MSSGPRTSVRKGTILIVIGELEIGGAERHLQQILPRLRQRGWQVAVYCLGRPGKLAPAFESGGVEVIAPPVSSDGRRHRLLYRILRLSLASVGLWLVLIRRRPDVVHFFLPLAYLIGAPIAMAALCSCRAVSRRSLNDYQAGYPIVRRLEGLFHRRMRGLLGNSKAVVAQLVEEGAPAQRIRLLYNGIEPMVSCRARAEVRDSLGVAQDAILFAVVANLIPYKGHVDLLAALAKARSRLPAGWRVLLVGYDAGIGDGLKQQAADLRIAEHLLWLGRRTDVPDLLGASDAGVLCSWQEGFSNSILEGMAAGLPMLVTDVGGNAEAVTNGKTGLVVPSHDPAALGEALVLLATDQTLRERLGAAARDRVRRCFDVDDCAGKYDAFYRSAVEGRDLPELDGAEAAAMTDEAVAPSSTCI